MGRDQFGRARSEARAKMWKDLAPFSRGPGAKKLFRAVRFHPARTGTLATQAKSQSVSVYVAQHSCLDEKE